MATTDETATDAFAERLYEAAVGALDLYGVYLGDELGYYRALADGPLTVADLAARTGTDERYTREWCEQQVTTGVLRTEWTDDTDDADERHYELPSAYIEALVDEESLSFVAPFGQLVVGAMAPREAILDAYRTGAGVPFEAYGRPLREGQSRINRPAFLTLLGEEWLPALPDVDERLRSTDPEPARVADVGCGGAWSCIGMARAYPEIRVDGYDLDAASVEMARENVREAGLDDRISVHHADASDALDGDYDLVTAFECVHDMADPVGALATMADLAGEDGTLLVVDERVGETFGDPTDVEAMMYGWSIVHCLPVGREDDHSTATGTVMRADTFREYAAAAGVDEVEVLPIESDFFQFYRLDPGAPETRDRRREPGMPR
ncbi:class I SAM-dependent methyltransferase [Halomarina rubra]|uniref:Class I SAM-dependent methyltransferase n=1 Tax=Halomarina rubra TaxID=2071873 RepID=A0ABD6ASK9_9EURY|nr:methyltransferase domain-containing protein [Halomarina rubra]